MYLMLGQKLNLPAGRQGENQKSRTLVIKLETKDVISPSTGAIIFSLGGRSLVFPNFAREMRKITCLSLAALALLFVACKNSKSSGDEHKVPAPGTVVASAEMPVTDDPLNKFTFSIKVVADSNVAGGVYDVDADYGPNYANGQFTMPKGGESLKPVIRKGNEPYTYIIGFKVAGDTTFYDYFQVSSSKVATKMQYIRAYSF